MDGRTEVHLMIDYNLYPSSPVLEAALGYLERGFRLIPVRPRGKAPLVNWKKFQSRAPTREEISRRFTQFPEAKIGLVTGAASGVIDIDIDSEEGLAAWRELCPSYGPTPESIAAKGRHIFFRHPSIPITNSVTTLRPAVSTAGRSVTGSVTGSPQRATVRNR